MSDTLENTNRLLSNLERKLSLGSNTSHQTHQSGQSAQSAQSALSGDSQSSVVVNRNLLGLGKQNVQSTVLQYIRSNEHEFSTNDLFEDRQARFLTQFGKHYNADTRPQDSPEHLEEDVTLLDDPTNTPENLHGIFYDFDDYDDEDENVDEDDDDMLIPPSPPRSPPRDIDPDKLYGLYDFSGPDPLHCTLARDEPVYLVNDEDNYWWLVRKMTKLERHQLKREKRSQMIYGVDDDSDEYSDEEDGKVGFVPAECLETYGERLARLNCFKNEELEKSGTTLPETNQPDVAAELADSSLLKESFGLEGDSSEVINSQEKVSALTRTSSSLKRKNYNSNKSVTFEDLSDLKLDEDTTDNDIHLPSRDVLKDDDFHKHYFDIPRAAIEHSLEFDKLSEVLSDVYPNETPLLVKKTLRKTEDEVAQQSLQVVNERESPLVVKKRSPKMKQQITEPADPLLSDEASHGSDSSEPVITQIIDINSSHESIASHSSQEFTPGSRQINSATSNTNPRQTPDQAPRQALDQVPVQTPDLKTVQTPVQTPDLQTPVFKFNATPYSGSNDFSDLNPPFKSSGYQNHDAISIGSFSPDTPKTNGSVSTTNKQEKSPENPASFIVSTPPSKGNDDANQFRRSVILDRLNKVTFDIQEQMRLGDELDFEEEMNHSGSRAYDRSYYNTENLTFGAHLKRSPEHNRDSGYDVDGVDLESDNNIQNMSNTCNSSPRRESVTPLTSLNLLNNAFHDSISKEVCNSRSIVPQDSAPSEGAKDADLDFGSSKSSNTADLEYEAAKHTETSLDGVGSHSELHFDEIADHSDRKQPHFDEITDYPDLKQLHFDGIADPVTAISNTVSEPSFDTSTDHGLDFASKSLPILEAYDRSIDSSSSYDFSNIALAKHQSTPTAISDRRKSKPVHDMFLPILGKFDDLAEKLAQLDDLL